MTTRRTILQGAAALVAPARLEFATPLDPRLAASPFGVLIDEYRQMLDRLNGLFKARDKAESAAFDRNGHLRDCPALKAAERDQRAWYDAEKSLIRLASRTRAANIDEVMHKLILWRLVDFDRGGFDEPRDMIPFSAYRDLLLLTGQASLTAGDDEKALGIVWDDNAFTYSFGDDDDDEAAGFEDDDFDDEGESEDDFNDGEEEDDGE